ncbi:MAG: alpha/beta hydrolase [Peptococcaceae bacterium]
MSKKIGCLLMHGFGGSIEEIKPLARHLEFCGYIVESPCLAGHTGNRKDLRGVTYQDWIRTAEEGYLKLQRECTDIHLVGFSMGGLIAVNLALKYEPCKIVTINTPIYYWDRKRMIRNILEDIREQKLKHLKRYFKSSGAVPFTALLNFRRLLVWTKPKLKEVKKPFLVIQAEDDDTARSESAAYIFNHVASPEKSIRYYDRAGHMILWSERAAEVMPAIEDFLKR